MATFKEVFGKKGIKYQATVRVKGFKPVYKTFDKKSEAKKWAADTEVDLKRRKKGVLPIKTDEKPILTVGEMITYFEKKVAPKRYSKPEQYTHMYDWWRDKIGDVVLTELDSPLLTHCQDMLAQEPPNKPYKGHATKSNSTVRKYMFALSAVLRYARRNLKLIDFNPMSDVDKPEKKKSVPRFLLEDERPNLFEVCRNKSDDLFLFALLLTFSGGRYDEVRTLRVENIDRANDMISFVETKNNEARGVPLYHKIAQLLYDYIDKKGIKSGYIFLDKKQKLPYFKGQLEKAIEKSGIKEFRIHDCRHTYASYLAQNGATLLEIAELLGHKTLNQVQIYAHLTKKTTAKLVRKMSANMIDDAILFPPTSTPDTIL